LGVRAALSAGSPTPRIAGRNPRPETPVGGRIEPTRSPHEIRNCGARIAPAARAFSRTWLTQTNRSAALRASWTRPPT